MTFLEWLRKSVRHAIATAMSGTEPDGTAWGGLNVDLKGWEFLGGQYIDNPNNEALALLSGTTAVVIEMEDAACYYNINQTGAYFSYSYMSYGYIPEDGARTVGAMSNLSSFHVHSPAGRAHVQFWKEE